MNLHEQILAEIERREQKARAAAESSIDDNQPYWHAFVIKGDDWAVQSNVDTIVDSSIQADAEHIALHDPADALRRYAHYRKVLERHRPPDAVPIGDPGPYPCVACSHAAGPMSHWVDTPCPEVRDVAEVLGIEVES